MQLPKITSFKRIQKFKEEEPIRPFQINRDPVVLNVLLYAETQSPAIHQFQKWIRKEQREKVNFIKLVDKKSIIPTIKTVLEKKHCKTYVISTKSITSQVEALIKANKSSELVSLLKELKFILFVNQVEDINPKNFWVSEICYISSKITQIQEYVANEIQKIDYSEAEEVSSLNSDDQGAFEEQFIKKWNMISLPKQSPKKQDEKQAEIVFNDVPGVGTYEVQAESPLKGSKSGTFSKQKKQRQ